MMRCAPIIWRLLLLSLLGFGGFLVIYNFNLDHCEDRTWCGEPSPSKVGRVLILVIVAIRCMTT